MKDLLEDLKDICFIIVACAFINVVLFVANNFTLYMYKSNFITNILLLILFCIYASFYTLNKVNLYFEWNINKVRKFKIIYLVLFLWGIFSISIYHYAERHGISGLAFIPSLNSGMLLLGSIIVGYRLMFHLVLFAFSIIFNPNRKRKIKQMLQSKWYKVSYKQKTDVIIYKEKMNIEGDKKDFILNDFYGIKASKAWLKIVDCFDKEDYETFSQLRTVLCDVNSYQNNSKKQQNMIDTYPKRILENTWCTLYYDEGNKTISFRDKEYDSNPEETFIAEISESLEHCDVWKVIVESYEENTKSLQIRDLLRKIAFWTNIPIKIRETVDINSANEKLLSALPGINIIKAKRIIQFRERERYFSSCEDFFDTMKIKKHFRKQMKFMIVANPISKNRPKDSITSEERKVDL